MPAAPPASHRPRELSRLGKVVLLVLAAYAVAVILPDTLRPTALYRLAYYLEGVPEAVTTGRQTKARPVTVGWYPLGDPGFTANNNGRVTSVDYCDGDEPCDRPAAGKLHVGDRIDLQKTAISDRRAVNQLVFVAHDRPIVLQVARYANGTPPGTVTLIPSSEDLRFLDRASALDAWTLVLDQLAGLFFIGLAALCVWRHPTRLAWGLFLYSIWYNSGQYFVWYANLPAHALRWFDWLQALFSAAGLTGLLMFALHFPRDSVEGWRRRAEQWLFVPFAALAGLSLWSFRNFTQGVPTERAYDAYYGLTFVVYLAVFGVFIYTYYTELEARPRIRWVILGALSGLLCFLFADVYEATSMLQRLPVEIPAWILQILYAVNVLFPIAVVYAVMRHRVINVRLVLNRSFVVLTTLVIATFGLAGFDLAFHEQVARDAPWIAVVAAVIGGMLHERLRGVTDVVDWLFFHRWHVAERDLKKAAEGLAQVRVGQIAEIDHALVDLPAEELNLTSAALFLRQADGSFARVHATASWPTALLPVIPSDHPLLADLKDAPLRLSEAYWPEPSRLSHPFRTPVLAVPIASRGVLRRIALFGPHTSDEALDRDELNVIGRLANSAAYAYTALEAEALRAENERLAEQLREARASMAAQDGARGGATGPRPETGGIPGA